MILLALQTYFLQVKQATLGHLLKEFHVDEKVLQDMLSFWIRKGKLKKTRLEGSRCSTRCGTCQFKCASKSFSTDPLYEWIG